MVLPFRLGHESKGRPDGLLVATGQLPWVDSGKGV